MFNIQNRLMFPTSQGYGVFTKIGLPEFLSDLFAPQDVPVLLDGTCPQCRSELGATQTQTQELGDQAELISSQQLRGKTFKLGKKRALLIQNDAEPWEKRMLQMNVIKPDFSTMHLAKTTELRQEVLKKLLQIAVPHWNLNLWQVDAAAKDVWLTLLHKSDVKNLNDLVFGRRLRRMSSHTGKKDRRFFTKGQHLNRKIHWKKHTALEQDVFL